VGALHWYDESGSHVADHAALWDCGSVTDLGTLGPPDVTSLATAINEGGMVVGYSVVSRTPYAMHAFVWSDGEMQDLGTLGGDMSQASAVNNNGLVAGYSYLRDDRAYHAFLWDGSSMQDLGTLPGMQNSWSESVNASGAVVGAAHNIDVFRGFLYDGSQLFDLNDLVAPSKWLIIAGHSINDAGQILATAEGDENGVRVTRAVLLNPD
jgi:probable HAF family extracellular repeat protein